MNSKLTLSCLGLFFVLILSNLSYARTMRAWDYDSLSKEATLIVIATPIETKKLEEKTKLPNIYPPTPVIGVETTFTVFATLKGNLSKETFVFHHYRLPDQTKLYINAPGLVAFNPDDKKIYLMFLQQEEDGKFTPIAGQTDPDISIKRIPNPHSESY